MSAFKSQNSLLRLRGCLRRKTRAKHTKIKQNPRPQTFAPFAFRILGGIYIRRDQSPTSDIRGAMNKETPPGQSQSNLNECIYYGVGARKQTPHI